MISRNEDRSSQINGAANRKRKQRSIASGKRKQRARNQKKRSIISRSEEIRSLHADEGDVKTRQCSNCQPENPSPERIREDAFRNITQFRAAPTGKNGYEKSVTQEMHEIRKNICNDLKNQISAIDPVHFFCCLSCGHMKPKTSSVAPRATTREEWMNLLGGKLYSARETREGFCRTCVNALRRQRVPFGAISRGCPCLDAILEVLSSLSRYERQLICLRLPCVYIWRSQGGFGQYGCRGSPVSFANPVSDSASKLPRYASKVFHVLLDSGQQVDIDCTKILKAILWLKRNNHLYRDIEIDHGAIQDIEQFKQHTAHVEFVTNMECDTVGKESSPCRGERLLASQSEELNSATTPSSAQGSALHVCNEELSRGTQGPIDIEGLDHLQVVMSRCAVTGVEDINNQYHAQTLIRHMLKPFSHRRTARIPSYDAAVNLESYFPVLFPYGKGGPSSTGSHLGPWVKHVLSVSQSCFAADLDFIFFVYSVLKRRRLTGLASFAPIRDSSTRAILQVRELLSSSLPPNVLANRIDLLLRSGTLNASFETLRDPLLSDPHSNVLHGRILRILALANCS